MSKNKTKAQLLEIIDQLNEEVKDLKGVIKNLRSASQYSSTLSTGYQTQNRQAWENFWEKQRNDRNFERMYEKPYEDCHGPPH